MRANVDKYEAFFYLLYFMRLSNTFFLFYCYEKNCWKNMEFI